MPLVIIGVALGSNLGNRRKHLDDAVDFLQTIAPLAALSSYYVSQPVDCPPGAGYFYNAVAQFRYEDDLPGLLERLQRYEITRGRSLPSERGFNVPRPIDLDILYADGTLVAEPRLTLPHPRLTERLFVLEPLVEIAPDWILPGSELTALELLTRCRQKFGKQQVCLRIA
ncbi:MAG: 2-amino-4-hydroxy-6-hydroxymethyldihydropteridine diphosphokinase [Verrucomicrobiales bacterium]|jgi:2-amino-4-hydroxy-6-hydroxymethyldihydropteridine diphosphokinase|nr:2-amino-4-hydroxy-6-hydroxymethyldihydropteridine diphosphokinase [Verrucomicrobiales bacterium]MDR1304749.1 2-amino-4-hydroxy-6-hydroxymethyldihydropteridine diphosphokinase [Verrucomicrobiales bacterium]